MLNLGDSSSLSSAEKTLASAATVDLGTAANRNVLISGTVAITSFGTKPNREVLIRFGGALTLTHNAASLILPGAANITTAAGDTAVAVSDASGNWRIRDYNSAASRPLASLAGQVPGPDGTVTAAQFMAILNTVAPILPTVLPAAAGMIWNNSGVISVS